MPDEVERKFLVEATLSPEVLGEDMEPAPPAPRDARRGILAAIERPLAVAFVATLGVLGAIVLGSAIASITEILIYIVLALFISLGLDPVVRVLERRGMKRGAGIGIVFGGFVVLAAAFLIFVLPPVVQQIAQLVESIPSTIAKTLESEWFLALPGDLQLAVSSALAEVAERLHHPETIAAIGGGVLKLGVGIATLALAAAMATPVLIPMFAGADRAANERIAAYSPQRAQFRLHVVLRALDHALQAAYDRGASDAEIAPMWVARDALLVGIQSGDSAFRRNRI